MDDLSGAISQLLSNKESLNTILSLVGSLMNNSKAADSPPAGAAAVPASAGESAEPAASLPPAGSASESPASEAGPDAPAVEAAAIPDLSGMLSGLGKILGGGGLGGSSGPSDRSGLLVALKPYLRPARASQIDRAVGMLNTAYAVRSAIKTLGGPKSS